MKNLPDDIICSKINIGLVEKLRGTTGTPDDGHLVPVAGDIVRRACSQAIPGVITHKGVTGFRGLNGVPTQSGVSTIQDRVVSAIQKVD